MSGLVRILNLMSGSVRIQPPRLRLVVDEQRRGGGEEILVLPASQRLERFVATAARAGLGAAEAIGLVVEYALALQDATAFGLDADTARRRLNEAADRARAARPLGPSEAAYVRRLTHPTPRPAPTLPNGLRVHLGERISTRARGTLSEAVIKPGAVEEMVSWKIAATLEGRTLGEWALHNLARSREAA